MYTFHRLLLAILILSIVTHRAVIQAIIKTNVLYPAFVKGASLALEVATPRHTSVNLYAAFGSNGALVLADTYTFQNLIVEKRFYNASSSGVLQGLYFAPYAKYMHRKIYQEGLQGPVISFTGGRDSDGHSLGLGTAVGLQVPNRFIKRTFVDAFAGAGYLVYASQVDHKNPDQVRFGHVDLRVGLSFGYLF